MPDQIFKPDSRTLFLNFLLSSILPLLVGITVGHFFFAFLAFLIVWIALFNKEFVHFIHIHSGTISIKHRLLLPIITVYEVNKVEIEKEWIWTGQSGKELCYCLFANGQFILKIRKGYTGWTEKNLESLSSFIEKTKL